MKFPLNEEGRKFNIIHCNQKMPKGELILRYWLIYSVSKDSVFCFCCRLFATGILTFLSSDTGYRNWKNISQILSDHERSSNHMKSFYSWMELSKRLNCNKTIDSEN